MSRTYRAEEQPARRVSRKESRKLARLVAEVSARLEFSPMFTSSACDRIARDFTPEQV